jgi:hypothetical protein
MTYVAFTIIYFKMISLNVSRMIDNFCEFVTIL